MIVQGEAQTPKKANCATHGIGFSWKPKGLGVLQDIPPWFICVWNSLKQLFLSDYICTFIGPEIQLTIIDRSLSNEQEGICMWSSLHAEPC